MITSEFNYNLFTPSKVTGCYEEKWLNEVDSIWNTVKTFNDLIKLNKEFIKGNIPNTPVHLGKLEDIDSRYITNLLKLSDMEIFTTGGQQYLQAQYDTNTATMVLQREYLSFAYKFKNKQNLNHILQKLNDDDVFYYSIYSINNNTTPLAFQTPKLQRIDSTNPEFWVTRELNKNTNTFTNYTHIGEPVNLIPAHRNYSYYVKNYYNNKVFFEIWNTTWTNDSPLLPKIIKCFSQ
jgi:hypothetical protein